MELPDAPNANLSAWNLQTACRLALRMSVNIEQMRFHCANKLIRSVAVLHVTGRRRRSSLLQGLTEASSTEIGISRELNVKVGVEKKSLRVSFRIRSQKLSVFATIFT
jgi:hypothetical protein